MSDRSAEEGHDAVAHDLVDRALVVMDRLHHSFEYRVEQTACLLGISVGEQFHRRLEVGEEDGDVLAFSFEGSLRGQDPLGKVPRRVGLGRGEATSARLGGGAGAFRAELGGRRQRCAAAGTGAGEWAGALLAELGAGAILVLAPRTSHGEPRLIPPSESSRELLRCPDGTETTSLRITPG